VSNPRPGPRRGRPAPAASTRSARGSARGTRPKRTNEPSKTLVHLPDDVVAELRATARPGKAEILIKVFAEAATAFSEGDFDEAIRLAEQAKHIALRAAGVRELLGLAYYRKEQWKEAAAELSAFRRISGSTEQNPVIADSYRAQGKPGKALEICDEIDPRSVTAEVLYEGHIVAAGTLSDMDRVDHAIARLEALDLDPGTAQTHHLRAWYALADLLEKRGRFTQALSYFDRVANSDPELTDASERAARLRDPSRRWGRERP
jgi:tetratricopeptide (TPR) repeat protein